MAAMRDQLAQVMSYEMADDNMDVVSEYGHADGEEDIDIDIDLTTAQVDDEDTMIDDPQSDIDVQEDLEDVMVEDDQQSYQMDDVNDQGVVDSKDIFINDIQISEVTEPGSMTVDLQVTRDDALNGQDIDDVSDIGWEEPQTIEESEHIVQEPSEQASESTKHDESVVQNTSAHNAAEDEETLPVVPDVSLDDGSRRSSSTSHPVSEPIVHVNAQDSVYEPANLSAEPSAEQDDETTAHDSPRIEAHQDLVEAGLSNEQINVTILYQGTEYALIAHAEDDDPDNFFFKNKTLVNDSLARFLEGLRDILRNEVSDDDELCLSIPDLGISISEVSNYNPTALNVSTNKITVQYTQF